MNRIFALGVALTILGGCSQDKQDVDTTNTTHQTPSQPTGAIVGVVTSLRTGVPLQGVVVSVPQASGLVTDTTDTNGSYALPGLAAGATYVVRFSMSGYVPRLAAAAIPDSAGDFPMNGTVQLNVPLAQGNATVRGNVTARDGAPAANVTITADLRSDGFDVVAVTTTNAQGAYTLSGLPGAPTGLAVDVVTQPWDADRDGYADYDALARVTECFPGATSLLDIDLRSAAADLLLLTSDVEDGAHPASAVIRLTFNRPLDLALSQVTLFDSAAGEPVAVTATLDTTGKILTITPVGGTPLAAYHGYGLTVDALATNGDGLTVSRSFVADVPTLLLPAVAGLAVNPASADYDTTTYTLSWNATALASGYQVWVRDTSANPSWLLLKTIGSMAAPSTSVTLPGTFDWYTQDGLQTPLAFGVKVDFAVVAVNAAGDAPAPSSATPVRRGDTSAPGALTSQTGQADNSANGSPRTITLGVTFDEYMDPAIAPTISLPAGLTSTFAWNPNTTSGTFTITIPASTDGRGPFNITGARDTSGNVMTPRGGNLTSISQLVVNGGFETGDLTGWTVGHTSTSTDPVMTTTVAAGSYAVRIGNTTASAQSGLSQIYQTVVLPSGYSSLIARVSFRPYTSYPYAGYDTSTCVIQNAAGTVTHASLFSTYANAGAYGLSSPLDITAYGGQTVRIMCQTSQAGWDRTGVYVDDVSIVATP